MSETIRTYSPQEVNVTWGSVALKNFADGTFIEASRSVANSNATVGASGDVGITFVANKTGTVTFTCMQTGVTNRVLSEVVNSQETSGKLIRADLLVSDPSGSWHCIARNCHIMELPTVSLGDDQNSKAWTFFAEKLEFNKSPSGFTGTVNSSALVASAVELLASTSAQLEEALG